jgi:hypothetical protein
MDKLPKFNGTCVDLNDWKDKLLLKLQQYSLEKYILQENIIIMTTDSREQFMLYFKASSALSMVGESTDKTGFYAWKALCEEYDSKQSQTTTSKKIRNRIKNHKLGKNKCVKDYVNKLRNYRIQLRNVPPLRDISDEDASSALMEGL